MNKNIFFRKLLGYYRSIQYIVKRRKKIGIMPPGLICTHEPFEQDINHGDVVHPCVRYIPEGFLGHTWWMVYTPYYASNDTTENPILCYAESDEPVPPIEWTVAYQVQGQPRKGYNSDPTLLYDDGRLYVMWRENLTDRCDKAGFVRATFGAEILKDGIGEVFGPLVGTKDFENDNEVSPTFIKCKDGKYRCIATHLRFHSEYIQKSSPFKKKILCTIASILDLLGFWSQQKGYGYAIWESDSLMKPFAYKKTLKFSNCNKLYRPWHMDLFEDKENLYAVIQTNQCNADICLAESSDGINFRMFSKPLMTNKTCGKIGIYKPCAGVIDGTFYLYYTAQDLDNRALNKLYLTTMPWAELMKSLK